LPKVCFRAMAKGLDKCFDILLCDVMGDDKVQLIAEISTELQIWQGCVLNGRLFFYLQGGMGGDLCFGGGAVKKKCAFFVCHVNIYTWWNYDEA